MCYGQSQFENGWALSSNETAHRVGEARGSWAVNSCCNTGIRWAHMSTWFGNILSSNFDLVSKANRCVLSSKSLRYMTSWNIKQPQVHQRQLEPTPSPAPPLVAVHSRDSEKGASRNGGSVSTYRMGALDVGSQAESSAMQRAESSDDPEIVYLSAAWLTSCSGGMV